MNFMKAYGTYRRYCEACEVQPCSLDEFKKLWESSKPDHKGCNYNYNDQEVMDVVNQATIWKGERHA